MLLGVAVIVSRTRRRALSLHYARLLPQSVLQEALIGHGWIMLVHAMNFSSCSNTLRIDNVHDRSFSRFRQRPFPSRIKKITFQH